MSTAPKNISVEDVKKAATPGKRFTGTPEILAKVREVGEAYVESWRTGDRDARRALFHPEARFCDPVGTPEMNGIKEIEEFWDKVESMEFTPDPEFRRVVACANEGLILFVMHAKIDGVRKTSVEIFEHIVLDEEGKIIQMRALWDDSCITVHG